MSGLKQDIPDSIYGFSLYKWLGYRFYSRHRPGDTYSLIYEEILIDGEKVIDGDILISEFMNQNEQYIAVRHDLNEQTSEYFNLEGENVKSIFRSPVKLSYISSKYNLKRRHPVLHTIRAHKELIMQQTKALQLGLLAMEHIFCSI